MCIVSVWLLILNSYVLSGCIFVFNSLQMIYCAFFFIIVYHAVVIVPLTCVISCDCDRMCST